MTEKEITRAALVMLLKRKRQGMTPAERSKRKKPARWLYPWATEHGYAVLIRAWVKPVIVYVREYIQKHHEAVLRGDGADAVIRKDAVAGQSFYAMIQALNGWVGAYISDDDEKMLVSPIFIGLGKISDNAFAFNGTQYKKSVKSALGMDFPSDESWWPDARDFWRRQNYDLIRSDIKKYISDINAATERAVTNGLSVKSLMKEIQSLDEKITKSRANFIARDQIGKLNGIITQRRQEDIGLSMYEWSSSGDERVRSSHALMDGKLCRWDDATVCSEDGGKTWKPRPAGAVLMHPGQDYQCRCCALAWFDELIDEADRNISTNGILSNIGMNGKMEKIPAKDIVEVNLDNLFYKIQGNHSVYDDLKVINKGVKPTDTSRISNCTKNAIAYYLRRKGYDVESLPSLGQNDFFAHDLDSNSWLKCLKGHKKIKCEFTGKKLKSVVESTIEDLDEDISFVQILRNANEAHVFVAEKVDGEIEFFDPTFYNLNIDGEKNFEMSNIIGCNVISLAGVKINNLVKFACKSRR